MNDIARLLVLLTLPLLSLLPAAARQPEPPVQIPAVTPLAFEDRTQPTALIASYYNAIGRAEYARAYAYWEQAPGNQSESQFAAGFADTVSARALVSLPIFEDAGAGNMYASVAALVMALQRDNTEQFYQGCFILHKTNVPVGNAAEPDPNWYLQSATLRQFTVPDLNVLGTSCEANTTLTDNLVVPQPTSAVGVIESYFTSIATYTIADASAYWEEPGSDVVVGTYVRELRAMTGFNLFINPEVIPDSAEGTTFAGVAALLMLTGPDGSQSYLTGCYTTRHSDVTVGNGAEPDPNWLITDAAVNLLFDPLQALGVMAAGCAGQG